MTSTKSAPAPRRTPLVYLAAPALLVAAQLLVPFASRALPPLVFLVGVFATVSLTRRLGHADGRAVVAGLLLATTPLAVAIAGTSLPDALAVASAAIGIERLVAWRNERRAHQFLAGGLAIGLAVFARFASLTQLLAFVAARLHVDALAIAGFSESPHSPVWERSSEMHFVGYLVELLVVVPLALPWIAIRKLTRPWRQVLPWRLALFGLPASIVLVASTGHPDPLWAAPLACITLLVLSDIFLDALARRDAIQLALLAWLLVAVPLAIHSTLPSTYVAASAPAAAILIARALPETNRVRSLRILTITLCAGFAISLLLLRSDDKSHDLQRKAKVESPAPRP